MGFAERAVMACDKAMTNGTLSERHVRDVLRNKKVDVQPLARHISSENLFVRMAVARIIGQKGDVESILDDLITEEDPEVLRQFLCAIGTRGGDSVRALERMISSEDQLVREEAISMLRRSGRADSLLPLLFDRDDSLVNRAKRYINEQKRQHTENPIS